MLGNKRKGVVRAAIAVALLGVAAPAGAICTKSGTITSSSTAIVGANDLSPVPPDGRHYIFIQNTGTTNPMNVAIGSHNSAASSDLYLGPGASLVLGPAWNGAPMPSGDVAAIAPSGNTTFSFCDF
jgi:hypothetical protein